MSIESKRGESAPLLLKQAQNLIQKEIPVSGNLCNLFSFLFYSLEDINWIGIYRADERENRLVLGEFQGKPACALIPRGKGVCGSVWTSASSCIVDDVHLFPGHIACDSDSCSEMVLPLTKEGRFLGVLDIDSPVESRFSSEDLVFFESIVKLILEIIEE